MGEMCYQVVRNIGNIDHVAIVDYPADKRLRFPALVNGEDLCSLTRRKRVVPDHDGEGKGTEIEEKEKEAERKGDILD